MGLGLSLKIVDTESGAVVTQRVDRPSALFGRDTQMVDCVLADRHVSKLHASVEIREGQFFVRDASSTNGTIVKGQRIDASSWTSLGPAAQDQEFAISKWRITVHAEHIEERSGALSVSLASLAGDAPRGMDKGQGTYAMNHPLDALAGVYADHLALIAKIHAALRRGPPFRRAGSLPRKLRPAFRCSSITLNFTRSSINTARRWISPPIVRRSWRCRICRGRM
jgi:predicted component of type VI protein secretion system